MKILCYYNEKNEIHENSKRKILAVICAEIIPIRRLQDLLQAGEHASFSKVQSLHYFWKVSVTFVGKLPKLVLNGCENKIEQFQNHLLCGCVNFSNPF